jgi:hypothetical protein
VSDERFDPRDEAWLFDGGPAPDAASARLERLLALQRAPRRAARRPRRGLVAAALAAALALALGAIWIGRRAGPSGYEVRLAGGVERLRAGELLETPQGGARLQVAELGDVRLEPGARLVARDAEPGRHRFYLERGTLTASITAEPGAFGVDTPAGSSVDLGCLYTLAVDERGDTQLSVALGRVAFTHAASGRDVYVPAGAALRATVDEGPTSPLWESSTQAWRAEVAELDRAPAPAADQLARLASAGDTLALWHLLQAPAASTRGAAFDRLLELVAAPREVARAAIVEADPRSAESLAARRAWLARMDWYGFEF